MRQLVLFFQILEGMNDTYMYLIWKKVDSVVAMFSM